MAIKVLKGQVCDGIIAKNTCHDKSYLCGIKFHDLLKKSHVFI